jgi:tetraacyldisaccharide 4'-kinase
LAFCGLANPDKFYKTLKDDNFQVKKTISFPDHHKYTTMDIQNLKKEASEKKLKLITTEKDYVKIDQKNRNLINVLSIELGFNHNDENKFKSLLKETLDG